LTLKKYSPQMLLLNTCLISLAVGISVVSYACSKRTSNDDKHKMRHFSNTAYYVAILLWPVVFDGIVGYEALRNDWKIWFGFLWPIFLLGLHLQHMGEQNRHTAPEAQHRHNELKSNANALIASAWGMGALLAVVMKTEGQSSNGARIMMISLLMCIAFLLPSTAFATSTYPAQISRTVQNSVLNMAIGLFISGIVVSWNDSKGNIT
jgi:hypothetical protein